ncbi:MAG: hypothetical protein OEM25_05070 [Gammaproteobacteria bacterium]|nr:hypothetical protein [Gammaproteobacteria bacterium]
MLTAVFASACSPAEIDSSGIVGTLEDKAIDEASGLAVSRRRPDALWVINDDGPAVLYAVSTSGKSLGHARLADASNRDWEDLASYDVQGQSYLLVADIGDNESRRDAVRLYVLPEPGVDMSQTMHGRRIDYRYPDGPRDAEAIAVDVENERVLILSKRDIPAVLYSVSLSDSADAEQTATRLGVVASLPQPGHSDIAAAPIDLDWHWQPTAMDISADGAAAVILTPSGVYLYRRTAGEDWSDALQRQPQLISRSKNSKAESIAFDATGNAIYITLEQVNAPLFRLDVDGVPDQ